MESIAKGLKHSNKVMRKVSIRACFKAGFLKIIRLFILSQIKTMVRRKKYMSTGLKHLRVWPGAAANI